MKTSLWMLILMFFVIDSGWCIEKTETGFYYPMGSSNPGSYSGWLASGCNENSQYFDGEYHLGYDYECSLNDQVYAIADGEVFYVSKNGWGEGNRGVLVKHRKSNGEYFLALYGHLITDVVKGDYLIAGKQFGTIGFWRFGNHLHFGIVDSDKLPANPWGRMSCSQWPSTNGFVDPIKWIKSQVPYPNIGYYVDGFHPDGTSQAFIKSHEWFSPKIGWPVDNGGGIHVHEWRGKRDASFSVLAQDFLGDINSDHFGSDGRSVLILNDLDQPVTAYLLASGFYGYYKQNDGPYRFGVPITWEEELGFSNSPLNNSSDPVRPGDQITVQKFKRRKNGSYYNNERRTLIWKEGIEVQEFSVGEFSIDRCESSASGQWCIQGSMPQNDIPWPLAGVGVPTGRWFIKPGVYQFVFHDDFGRRVYGSQFLAVITEGNYQPAEPSIIIDQPDTASDPPDTQVVISDPDPPDTQVVVEPDPEPEPNPGPEPGPGPDPPSTPDPAGFKASVVISDGFEYDQTNDWCLIHGDTLTEVLNGTENIHYLCQAENVPGRYRLRIEVYRDDVLWWPTDGKWGKEEGRTGVTKTCVPFPQLQDEASISGLAKPRVEVKVLFFIKLLDENKEIMLAEGSYDIINPSVSVTNRFSKESFLKQEALEYYDLMGRRIAHQEKRYLPQGVFIAKMKKLERRMLNVSK